MRALDRDASPISVCRRVALLRAALSGIVALAATAGCEPDSAAIMAGDATAVEIRFSGPIANANDAARRHCAAYERIPRYLFSEENKAYFACDRP